MSWGPRTHAKVPVDKCVFTHSPCSLKASSDGLMGPAPFRQQA